MKKIGLIATYIVASIMVCVLMICTAYFRDTKEYRITDPETVAELNAISLENEESLRDSKEIIKNSLENHLKKDIENICYQWTSNSYTDLTVYYKIDGEWFKMFDASWIVNLGSIK